MERHRRSPGFFGTAALSAVLSALMVVVIFGAGTTNAGLQQKKHAALAKEVTVDGTLAKESDGWVIKVKAANSGRTAQACNLGTALTSMRNSMMSRVPPTPRVVWKSTVAVNVPAGGEADQKVAVPADVAKRIDAATAKALAKKPAKDGELDVDFEGTEHFNVRIQVRCDAQTDGQVS